MKSKIDEKFYKGDKHPKAFTVGELKNILKQLPDGLRIAEDTSQIVVFNINDNPVLEFMEKDY